MLNNIPNIIPNLRKTKLIVLTDRPLIVNISLYIFDMYLIEMSDHVLSLIFIKPHTVALTYETVMVTKWLL